MRFLLFLPVLLWSFETVVESEGAGMSKILSYQMAIQNAKARAVMNFETEVQSSVEISKNSSGKRSMEYSTKQTSSGKVVSFTPFDEKTKFETCESWNFYITKLKAKVVVESSETKPPKIETPKVETPKVETPKVETPKVETSKVETSKVETSKVETPKVETPKAETPKAETLKVEIPKPKENFQIFADFQIRNPYWKDLDRYLLLIPEEKFGKLKFSETRFPKSGERYRNLKTYLFKIENSFRKNLEVGKYRIAFLIGNRFLMVEIEERNPKFHQIEFRESFQEKFEISNFLQ